MALVRVGQCIKCLAPQDESARPGCKNPDWHAAPAPAPTPDQPYPCTDFEPHDAFCSGGEGCSRRAEDEDGPFA